MKFVKWLWYGMNIRVREFLMPIVLAYWAVCSFVEVMRDFFKPIEREQWLLILLVLVSNAAYPTEHWYWRVVNIVCWLVIGLSIGIRCQGAQHREERKRMVELLDLLVNKLGINMDEEE